VTPSLEGVRAKIARAHEHLEDLKLILSKSPDAEARQTVRADDEAQRWIIETIVEKVPEVPFKARILIGDVVHSLAAALDHLVYQLSLSHQLAIGTTNAAAVCDVHKTHFPIFLSDADDAPKRINHRLKLMAERPANLIRNMQPYERSAKDPTLDPNADPLWILFKLDVIDKHRMVLAMNQLANVDKLTISAPDQEPEIITIPNVEWQPFKEGAKLMELSWRIDQALKPDVKFHLNCAVHVQFAETGLWCDGKPVVEVLRKLIEFTDKAVISKLVPFVVGSDALPA
jgi:hypothetical protein